MVHSLASSPTAGSSGAGMSVHLVFHLPFPALGSLPVSRSPQGLCSGLALGSCPCHSCPPLPPMVLRSCSSRPFLRLSSLLSLPRYLCWVDRDLRLSKFVTNFLLFADTLSLRMKRRGDGSREGSSTGVSSPGPEGGGAGGRVWRSTPGPVPWGPLPCPQMGTGSGCGIGVGRNLGRQGCGAQCARSSPPHSAAVVNAISLYMRHLGVRTKSGDKKSGRNFFRKKVLP